MDGHVDLAALVLLLLAAMVAALTYHSPALAAPLEAAVAVVGLAYMLLKKKP
ncbi:hypothetical protein [Streptacidiphilus pinicola]|uniref:hypothetical protein n=1 Tax=Streptacidiphilus pinicola TaxID=2219663 RepID=UPI0014035D8F|nr:hypothetical protein [Streptacidiphilus pinicola]